MVVLIAGIFLYFGLGGKNSLSRLNLDNSSAGLSDEEVSAEETPVEPDAIFQEPIVYNSLKELYSHTSFSFKYPDGFKATANIVAEGEIITVENTKGSGFQIYSMAWDESGPITPERILQDELDAEINDPKNADLDGAKTLVFYGQDEDMGETFEAWTVRKGKLYQISGPKTAEKLIIEILETWRWK